MRKLLSIVLYTALMLGANASVADQDTLKDLRLGDMKKLIVHSEPKAIKDAAFEDETGAAITLADYQGKVILVNFWATWCAPCRAEMPSLDALQKEMGDDSFEVVTIATGRNPPPMMKKFFAEAQVTALPMHRDPKQALARSMGVLGLPATVLINAEGQEVARLIGDADWAADEAKAVVASMTALETASPEDDKEEG